jgi:outer membrane protein OmpA-like peptidoglycan-associated protein
MRTVVRACVLVVIVALLGACATPELVVLVPSANGKVGKVIVTSTEGETTLDQAYAGARVEKSSKPEPLMLNQAEVDQLFAQAIAAQPPRPESFLLYFREGTDDYMPDSKEAFERVFAEVARRQAAEIALIGHTDRVGKVEINDELSLKRAERVRKDFIDRGTPASAISVAGRGDREPIVPTADQVSEPANRRVEINVR